MRCLRHSYAMCFRSKKLIWLDQLSDFNRPAFSVEETDKVRPAQRLFLIDHFCSQRLRSAVLDCTWLELLLPRQTTDATREKEPRDP